MKINTHNLYELFNTVKKSNGIKLYLMYAVNNLYYLLSWVMRILNY